MNFKNKFICSSRVKEGLTRIDELYNDLISFFEENNWTFEKSSSESTGGYIAQVLCNI